MERHLPMEREDYLVLQEQLATQVVQEDSFPPIHYIAGVDVAYEKEGNRVVAALTILQADTLALVETAIHAQTVSFPYVPGLFSFRELPPVLKAYEQLSIKPDLVVCDAQGYAHPRRFGLACHLGVQLDMPTIGCAKTPLIGEYQLPEQQRGSYTALVDQQEVIGRVLRTQAGVKPVFVSVGHRISLPAASDWVLRLCSRYRLPETTRTADHAVKMALKQL